MKGGVRAALAPPPADRGFPKSAPPHCGSTFRFRPDGVVVAAATNGRREPGPEGQPQRPGRRLQPSALMPPTARPRAARLPCEVWGRRGNSGFSAGGSFFLAELRVAGLCTQAGQGPRRLQGQAGPCKPGKGEAAWTGVAVAEGTCP